MSDRIMVMKSGKLIEFQESDLLYNHPKKKYTKICQKDIKPYVLGPRTNDMSIKHMLEL